MTDQLESRVTTGLNDFRIKSRLSVFHPSVAPTEVTSALQREPSRSHLRGEQRRTPGGKPLKGVYPSHYWFAELAIPRVADVAEYLEYFLGGLSADAIQLCRQIDESGGSVEIWVAMFVTQCCDNEIPAATLRKLGEAGITLRLDYYCDLHKDEPMGSYPSEPDRPN